MATSRYVTLISVRHAGVDFPAGTPMALSDELAAPLLAVKAIQAQAGALPPMPAVKGAAVTLSIDSATGQPVDDYLRISRARQGGLRAQHRLWLFLRAPPPRRRFGAASHACARAACSRTVKCWLICRPARLLRSQLCRLALRAGAF